MNKTYLGSYLVSVFVFESFEKNPQFSYVQRGKAEKMSKDISHKRLEEYNDVFIDIFNNIIFSGKQILEEEGLKKVPNARTCDGI